MTTILVSLFALVCVGLVACKYSQEDMEQWEAFKTKYEKRYESVKEEEKRRMIFKSKLDQIREHNILYDRGEVSYQLGVNEFTDKTLHEVPRGLATIREGDIKVVCNNKVHQPRNHLRLPENVDWRKKGVVTEVKNQKKCLTCWAFSATGALEGQHALKSKNLVSLSEQDLTDCDNTNGHCMGGGLPWKAFTYISHHGIDSEESYPYEDKRGKCRFSKKTVAATDKGCHKVPANEEALKEAVATVGPISVCIDSTAPGFDNYKGGIYNSSECYSEPSEVDHAVLVVGYGTTARGEDYWLVKNSWGTTWGEEGYMRLARHFNRCGIANFGSYPLV